MKDFLFLTLINGRTDWLFSHVKTTHLSEGKIIFKTMNFGASKSINKTYWILSPITTVVWVQPYYTQKASSACNELYCE